MSQYSSQKSTEQRLIGLEDYRKGRGRRCEKSCLRKAKAASEKGRKAKAARKGRKAKAARKEERLKQREKEERKPIEESKKGRKKNKRMKMNSRALTPGGGECCSGECCKSEE